MEQVDLAAVGEYGGRHVPAVAIQGIGREHGPGLGEAGGLVEPGQRRRLGPPQRVAYGPTEIEKLDIFRTKQPNAPIFFFIHGGAWLHGSAKDYAYAAETYVNAGAHYVVPDFIAIDKADGDLGAMAAQVRRAVAWTYKNAASFGGDVPVGLGGLGRLDLSPDTARHVLKATAIALGADRMADQ